MSQPVIRVENLSKAYRIGLKEEIPDTIVSAIAGWTRRPFENFRRLRQLNTFSQNGDVADIIWALKDVSFEVADGEVVGIIGSNGAGKSTLLKILSRITDPTSGRATIQGRVSSLLEVGTGFHPELTGRENIYLNGTILGMTKREIDRKFDEIVDFSGVEKFLDTPIKRYSSGMQVRLAFSVAAHLEPEILIIDEVLAVGDAEFQSKCLRKMQDVARGGRTVLFVSHNMAAVEQLCTRGIFMRAGALVSQGNPRELIESHLLALRQKTVEWDLHSLPRSSDSQGSAQFRKCWILNASGEEVSGIGFLEPLSIRFCVEANSLCKKVAVVVGIETHSGARLLTAISEDDNETFDLQPNTPTIIEVHFPELALNPGAYQLSIALRRGNMGLDTLIRCVMFDVSDRQRTDRRRYNGKPGLITVPARWCLRTESSVQ